MASAGEALLTNEGLTPTDTKNFSVRSYLQQLTPVLAEALSAMEKEDPEDPVKWLAQYLDDYRTLHPQLQVELES
ncbi:hypothetical protein AB1Y20_013802 [Prymnesium parvum]|uniref:RIIa domain-containing protein n=1 Tax=Prymnesium parvum TaxID=97485 RepID=A0AB34IH19_PRYPA